MEVNTNYRQTAAEPGKVDQSLLEAEISFWQEMIKFCDPSITDESLERMQQALALAQTKLNHQLSSHKSERKSGECPGSNVYFIKKPNSPVR